MESNIIRSDFVNSFPILVQNLIRTSEGEDLHEINNWIGNVLEYNVPHGKLTRGLTTAMMYRYLVKDASEENIKLSYVLGWCIEIIQASFLIADDIMDGSEMRRGRPCWYKVENKGVVAFNDSVLLENIAYKILNVYFRKKPYYTELVDILHDTVLKTTYGQSLDTRSSFKNNPYTFSMNLYKTISKYKTSYYSFYAPIRLAMTMAEMTDINLLEQAKSIALDIGYLFQVQDDYLDCFGDCDTTGKIGTDIQDGKCTWLFATALEKSNRQQKCFLKKIYGIHDDNSVKDVRNLYIQLKMEESFSTFEENMKNRLLIEIERLPPKLPKSIFIHMLNGIYKRIK